MFERARVAEKIKMLEGYFPDILVKNATIYVARDGKEEFVLWILRFVVKMWSNQENRVRKKVKNPCEAVAYAMHSSGKNSLAVGLSPYKIAKINVLASKLLYLRTKVSMTL